MPRRPKRSTVDQSSDRLRAAYPIRAVSRMTGVSIDTLRAWERRYGAVVPVRDERGRVYTDANVKRIRLLHAAVTHGHAIGRAARMTDTELETIAKAAAPERAAAPDAGRRAAVDNDQIVAALERFDAAGVERELGRAAALLRPPELLREVVVPVLTEVGERWRRRRASIAHEHMLSASVRNVLGSLLRVHMRADVPDRLLFATPQGERHEFGTLGAAMLAASGGLGVIYLGPDMPADDIVGVTRTVDVDVVVLGVSDAENLASIEAAVADVARRIDPKVELWLGGGGASKLEARLGGRALAVTSYEALEGELVRVGARF